MTQENTLKETVISVLKTIYDPEIPVDIWTLHLIYGVDVDDEGNVKIVMTVTAPNCPVAETLLPVLKNPVSHVIPAEVCALRESMRDRIFLLTVLEAIDPMLAHMPA